MVIVLATLKTKHGMRAKVADLARPCIKATRNEEGCIKYDLLSLMDDETTLNFVECWETLETLRAHSKSAHVAAFREARKEMMEDAVVKIFDAKEVQM